MEGGEVKDSSISKWEKSRFCSKTERPLDQRPFCSAQWPSGGGRRRGSSAWRRCQYRVTQKPLLCEAVRLSTGFLESISSQHCRRTAGRVRSTQVHSTGGSRGPLGWLQRLPNPEKREEPVSPGCFTVASGFQKSLKNAACCHFSGFA